MSDLTKQSRFWSNGHVELAHLDCSGHAFPKHFHNEYIIGANTCGHEQIWIDGKLAEAGLNDLTLYNPGEVQASYASGSEWSFVSLYLEPRFMEQSMGIDHDIMFSQSVLHCAPFAAALRGGVLRALSGGVAGDEIEEFVVMLLDGLMRQASDVRRLEPSRPCRTAMKQVTDRLLNDTDEQIQLSELAQVHSLSSVQLVRMFKTSYGMPPFQWRRIHRLLFAKNALRGSGTLADISQLYGFSDQSHFTREFRKVFAVTPAVYRRQVK